MTKAKEISELLGSLGLDEMANVDKRHTGIDVILHFTGHPAVGHWISVKAQQRPGRINNEEWVEFKVEGPDKISIVGTNKIGIAYRQKIVKFISVNYEAIRKYWTGEIQVTAEFLDSLIPWEK